MGRGHPSTGLGFFHKNSFQDFPAPFLRPWEVCPRPTPSVCLSAPGPGPEAGCPSRPGTPSETWCFPQMLVRACGVGAKPRPHTAKAEERNAAEQPGSGHRGRDGCGSSGSFWCPLSSVPPHPLPPAGAAARPPGVSEGWVSAGLTVWSDLSPERGAKPVTSFVKNLSALSDWYSIYTSAIAFTVSAPCGVGGVCSPQGGDCAPSGVGACAPHGVGDVLPMEWVMCSP